MLFQIRFLSYVGETLISLMHFMSTTYLHTAMYQIKTLLIKGCREKNVAQESKALRNWKIFVNSYRNDYTILAKLTKRLTKQFND